MLKTSPQRCYWPKQALHNDQGLHSRQVSACLYNSMPDLTEVPDFKKVLSAQIWWEEHKEVQMCSKIKTVAAFVSIQAKDFSTTGRAKHSFCSQEDKHSSRESARNLHFSLVWEWWGLFGCCSKGSTSFPVLSSSIACRTVPPPRAAKSSLNTPLWPNPVRANNKLRIHVQKGHLAPGAGDRRAIQPRREHLTAAQEGRAACLKPQPGQSITHVLRGAEMFQNIWKRQRLPEVTRWIHTVK